jgi:hypothetical protein
MKEKTVRGKRTLPFPSDSFLIQATVFVFAVTPSDSTGQWSV